MDVTTFTTHHLVKHNDLNHHGTLYAGRCADWFVESGFIAAASLTAHVQVIKEGESHLVGFITFIHVDLKGKPLAHGITITPTSPQDVRLQEEAKRLRS